MVLKIGARGLILHKHAYLREVLPYYAMLLSLVQYLCISHATLYAYPLLSMSYAISIWVARGLILHKHAYLREVPRFILPCYHVTVSGLILRTHAYLREVPPCCYAPTAGSAPDAMILPRV
eukprot:725652-Rhodomonas_salina.1